MILAIAQKEWKTLFRSPLTWLALAVIQLVLAWLFLLALEGWLQIQAQRALQIGSAGVTAWIIDQCLAPASTLLLAITPLLTMRLIADERASTGIELLLSSPLAPSHIILGKFSAAFGIYLVFLLELAVMPLMLAPFTSLDYGALASAMLGLTLFCAACCAVGVYFSSITRQSAVAALGCFGTLFLLWVAGIAQAGANIDSPLFAYISIAQHLHGFMTGLLNSSDAIYYLLLCGIFLTLSIRQLDNLRQRD